MSDGNFVIHPDMHELLEAKKALPKSTDPEVLRKAWADYGARLQRPYPAGMEVVDDRFRGVGVRIYRPAGISRSGPVVLYLHGGAFVKGSLDSGDAIAWGIADTCRMVVVSVDYRLAPDHPYPAALEDCHAVLVHCHEQGAALGVDGRQIGVWGDSAGGNLAAALCLYARDRGGPAIAAQALNYPCLTDVLDAPAYTDYADSPGLRTADMDRNWSLYLAGKRPTASPYAAPLRAPDLSRLPPAHVHIAEIDPLADDGRQYARRLEEAGNEVAFSCAEGMIHGYLRARFTGPAAAAEFRKPCDFLMRYLKA